MPGISQSPNTQHALNDLEVFLSDTERQIWHMTRARTSSFAVPEIECIDIEAHGRIEPVRRSLTSQISRLFEKSLKGHEVFRRALAVELQMLLNITSAAAGGRSISVSLFSGAMPADSNFFETSSTSLTVFSALRGKGLEYLETNALDGNAYRNHQLHKIQLMESILTSRNDEYRDAMRRLEEDYSFALLGRSSVLEVSTNDIAIWRGADHSSSLLVRMCRSSGPRLRFLAHIE
jgi:hypothetical protein